MISTQPARNLNLILGRDIVLGRELARGGEGKICTIVGDAQHVAKVFHKPLPERTAKLQAMIANPPHDPTLKKLGHISIAWPTALIMDKQGHCMGFTMPYIEMSESFPLLKLYNPQDRQATHRNFTWEYLLRMSRNLASVLAALHRKGYVVGDLNESNILVSTTALVTLVDCDSIQVPKRNNRPWRRQFFLCTVGKPEYTPPELQGRDFSKTNRKARHDNFSLAVLIFLMLMEGRHPFAGAWKGTGIPPTLAQNIQSGDFPYAGSHRLTPPKYGLPINTLPLRLQRLMMQCFVGLLYRPDSWWQPWLWQRPTAQSWFRALGDVENHLTQCSKNNSHIYSQHLPSCPWCQRMQMGIPDPFPPSQIPIRQIPRRTRTSKGRRWTRHIVRTLFFLLSVTLYGLEIYSWRYYGSWLLHSTLQVQWIVWLLLLITPLVIYLFLVLSARFRSS